MCCCSRQVLLPALLLCLAGHTAAEVGDFVIGAGAETDTAGGRAASAFGDLAVGGATWLTGALVRTQTGGTLGGPDTLYADAGIDHWFDPLGVTVRAAYWGDDDLLDSVDFRASAYLRNDALRFSADYERRNFEFIFQPAQLPVTRTAEFSAEGLGLTGRYRFSASFAVSAGGMSYDYSRDIRLQQDIDVLRILSASRLRLLNSLLDYRAHAGVEWGFGLQAVDLRAERWRTAIDGGRVDSLGIGFLTPVSGRSDMEFRFARDDSEYYGTSYVFSVFYYFFGG